LSTAIEVLLLLGRELVVFSVPPLPLPFYLFMGDFLGFGSVVIAEK